MGQGRSIDLINGVSSIAESVWMADNLELLGDQALNRICISGSHNSGMSERNGGTFFADSCNTLTQSKNIYDQLMLGIRYLDIRPVLSGGKYFSGHYSKIFGGSWQGSNGQSIKSIVSDINRFTRSRKELVILKVSHSLNGDLGNTSYRPFNEKEWEGLFKELENIQHLYKNPDLEVDLTTVNLNSFIAKSSSVFIVVGGWVELWERYGRGFYGDRNFPVFDRYSETNDFESMMKDQIKKMNDYSRDHYFLLSWTLTQSSKQASTCMIPLIGGSSVLNLADSANEGLIDTLYPAIRAESYPNIILIDNVTDDRAARMALVVNQRVLSS